MKSNTIFRLSAVCVLMGVSQLFAQGGLPNLQPDLQNYREPGFEGLNEFDNGMKQRNTDEYEGMAVRVGGDFALQFQGLSHETATNISDDMGSRYFNGLVPIGTSVNLPTANLNVDAQLAKGMRVHLRTYLSSRHHNETWVKGGYVEISSLDFIKEGFAEGFMENFSIRAGQDNFNYGDAVSRRSDNAMAIYNPFVGNYIMDANTVEPFLELNYFPGDFIVVVGASTGILNPTVVVADGEKYPPSFHGKLGWDSQINEDLRVRLTGSMYFSNSYNTGRNLYGGDRAGGRYYKTLDYSYINKSDSSTATQSNDFSLRFNPGIRNGIAFQVNPFVKFKGLEFFGIFEMNSGFSSAAVEDNDGTKASFTQLGAELIYRFGGWEQFYVGGRFNSVLGKAEYTTTESPSQEINRMNFGAGWFLTHNVLVKLEYMMQSYNENSANEMPWAGNNMNLNGSKVNGVVLEAVISF